MNRFLINLLSLWLFVFPGISKSETYPRDDFWGGGEWRLEVILNADRDEYGQATLLHESGFIVFGPVPVLGRSADSIAMRYENPDRDPLRIGGDTPTGTYEAWVRSTEERNSSGKVYSQVRSASGKLSYGNSGLLVMRPESGQALIAAANGRAGILAHEGELSDNHALRPTAGCLRFYPDDMKQLVSFIAHYRTTITAEITVGKVTIALPPPYARDEPDTAAIDPPPLLEFSDPLEDEWTEEMWNVLMETDQYVETGGLFSHLYEQGYYDPSTRLEDLNSEGMDAVRNAEYGGGGVRIGRDTAEGTGNAGSSSAWNRESGGNGNSLGDGSAAPECDGPADVICVPY